MKTLLSAVAFATLSLTATAALAQNVAIVNGKAVPKTRLNMLAAQVERSGRSVTPLGISPATAAPSLRLRG